MTHLEITDRRAEAFTRFLKLLPSHSSEAGVDLVILKAHMLIEEQLRQIIDERVKNPEALRTAQLDCGQCICLVEVFFAKDYNSWLWQALKRLNNIRNKIAHKLEWKGLDDSLKGFVQSFPSEGLQELSDEASRLEISLWWLFGAVSELVEYPSAVVLELKSPV